MNINYKRERQTLAEAKKNTTDRPYYCIIKTRATTLAGIIAAIERNSDFFHSMTQEEKEEFVLHADCHIYKDGVAWWEL